MPKASMRLPNRLYPARMSLSLKAVCIIKKPDMNKKKDPISNIVNITSKISGQC